MFSNPLSEAKQADRIEWSFVNCLQFILRLGCCQSFSNNYFDQRFVVMECFRIIRPKTAEIFFLCQHK